VPNLDLSAFVAEVAAHVLQVWPEVPPAQVHEVEDLELLPWEDLPPPYVGIYCAEFTRGEWGSANLSFNFPCEVYLVQLVSGPSTGLRGKLEVLIDHFWPRNPLTTGQVWDIGDWGTSRDLEPNRRFIEAGSQRRAGMVQLISQVGFTP
jgi:hypothetical protein